MDFKEYTDETKRTAPKLGSEFLDQLHMALGIATEAGELLDTYKKTFAYGKELDIVNIREELGDLFWYISNLMRMLDIDFEQTLQINIDKLRARFPDGFTSEKAINRDLITERRILEDQSSEWQEGIPITFDTVKGVITEGDSTSKWWQDQLNKDGSDKT